MNKRPEVYRRFRYPVFLFLFLFCPMNKVSSFPFASSKGFSALRHSPLLFQYTVCQIFSFCSLSHWLRPADSLFHIPFLKIPYYFVFCKEMNKKRHKLNAEKKRLRDQYEPGSVILNYEPLSYALFITSIEHGEEIIRNCSQKNIYDSPSIEDLCFRIICL